MRLVVARCTVDYEGRLESHLPEAVRLIMVKADGCVAVHSDGGAYKPLNWMNAPNAVRESPGQWEVVSPKGERLVITLHEVLSDSAHELGTDPGLQKDGVEAQLQALLAGAPDVIEIGLTLVRREYPTAIGPIDLLCRSADGTTLAIEVSPVGAARPARYVAIEVKRRAGIDAVEQLSRYVEYLRADPYLPGDVRGILVAQVIAPQAKTLAATRDLKTVEVDYDELRGRATPELRLF